MKNPGKIFRPLILLAGLLILWQLLVNLTRVPPYILPGPLPVAKALVFHHDVLFHHLQTTLLEIVAGLVLGTLLGSLCAIIMVLSPFLRRWLLPVLIISQAIPVFALAPLLVLWLGYGMASKIGMSILIIFFPVTSALFYGMRRTNPDLLELGRIMHGSTVNIFRFIIIPTALPTFASGLRVATAVAPIGAVIGEWVGSSAGLGYLMLHANARMQIDLLFAALVLLCCVSLLLYTLVDKLLNRLIYWEKEKDSSYETSL